MNHIRHKIDSLIRKLGPAPVTALVFVLMLVVCFFDVITGVEISFSVFYLMPIGLAVWYIGRITGFAVVVASAVCWYLADVLYNHSYSNPAVPVWNALVRLTFFMIVSELLSELKEKIDREKWDKYRGAVDEMLFITSTTCAPWTIIESDGKWHARIKVLKTVIFPKFQEHNT